MRNKKTERCIYCGILPADTGDHVPPKKFFPISERINLVKVPCCDQCNQKYHKDEDLFFAWIMFGDAGIKPIGKTLWKNLDRSYLNDKGLKKQIARSFFEIETKTPGGIYAGKRLATRIDYKRINNFLQKVTMGLLWIECKMRMPNHTHYDCERLAKDDLRIGILGNNMIKPERGWPEVFEYQYLWKEETKQFHVLMNFYGELYYTVRATLPDWH